MPDQFLLYGANGYTGELIARYAAKYNLKPILAGRREEALKPMAARLSLEHKVFDLHDTTALTSALREVKVVVHAAGPYDATAQPMVEACLQTGTHYLDLNGDLDVFELIKNYDAKAKAANIMLLPGAGFDVVPTDCLALFLKNKVPDAVKLQLAFVIVGSTMSRGTAITSLQKLGAPSASRKNGVIVPEPLGKKGMHVSFYSGNGNEKTKQFVMSLPWGDVSTAYFSTGIPDIETYTGIKKIVWHLLKAQGLLNWLLRKKFVHAFARKIIDKKPAGPDDVMRSKAKTLVWAKASNAVGQSVTAYLVCPEAYDVTAYTTLLITQKILSGSFKAGYQTPSSAYGEDLVLEIPRVKRFV